MRTPSHLLITAVLAKHYRGRAKINQTTLLLGAIVPDLPLFILSGTIALYLLFSEGRPITSIHSFMFDELYFNNPWWITAHNVFHAPLILLTGLTLTYRARAARGTGFWLFWFFAGCLFHRALDIPTHASDGPLLLFPFNWQWRFHSPVSYWEQTHFGQIFTVFEYALDGLLLGYLGVSRLKRKNRNA
jgi:LexA-binding, inner membrane-associated putative hydrolase